MKSKAQIAKENDLFRETMITTTRHRIVLTPGVSESPHREDIITAVRQFNDFKSANDPYGEHDFGMVDVKGDSYFWKMDYYDSSLSHYSDPAEGPCTRVLTIMLASEY